MKVKILKNIHIPMIGNFIENQECELSNDLAEELILRGQAQSIQVEVMTDNVQLSKSKKSLTN